MTCFYIRVRKKACCIDRLHILPVGSPCPISPQTHLKGINAKTTYFGLFFQGKFQISSIKMKGYLAKLKDFSPKLKVSEILFFLMPQNRWKKSLTYLCQQKETSITSFVLISYNPRLLMNACIVRASRIYYICTIALLLPTVIVQLNLIAFVT